MNSLLRKWPVRVPVIAAAAIIIVSAMISCKPDTSPTPEKLAALADTIKTPDVQSCRAIWSGTGTSRGKTTESYQEAAFTAPDRYHIKLTEDGAASEFIAIGDTQYIKSSGVSPAVMAALTYNTYTFLTAEYSLNSLIRVNITFP